MLDTDERITPELQQAIQAVLSSPQPGAVYSIARRNYFLGRFMRHSGWYPDRVTRLYERERYHGLAPLLTIRGRDLKGKERVSWLN